LRRLRTDAKIVKQLLRLMQVGGFESNVVPVRQIDLAYALGLSRVSVGKALDDLQRGDLIRLGYGEIEILDKEGLLRLIPDEGFVQ
ncbi:MAG: helix-turn-helix domain-containing protein, partial [Pseudomonadota bacterium]